ncbi:MAG: xanthine dehydrogenase family protein subunit M [Firmicutes bacterium]|nr:xanthine dehydrogenase family protein subunit M [Bacillota bacterium]
MTLGFIRPETVYEAMEFLSEHKDNSRIVAGATDVMVQMRSAKSTGHAEEKPLWMVDITNIPGLSYVNFENRIVRIGAMTTHRDIARSAVIRDVVPFLADACRSVGSPQIRTRGTIGGNIVNASPAADSLPPLTALSARLRLISRKGPRDVALEEFFKGPYRTIIEPDEILEEVYFEAPESSSGCAFLKLGRRESLAIARLSVAVLLDVDESGKISKAAIAPGACLPMPARITSAEEALIGEIPNEEAVHSASLEVGEEMVRVSGVRWSTEYKKPVVCALTKRAIWKALGVDED